VRVTEAAAIAAAKWVGKGDAKKGRRRGCGPNARRGLTRLILPERSLLERGKRDESPELYNGEKVGGGWKYHPPTPS